MSNLDIILRQAERLPEGGEIILDCPTHGKMNSLRTALARKAAKLYPSVTVSSDSSTKTVSVGKPTYNMTIIGELSPEIEKPTSIDNIIETLSPAIQRMIKLMRADGMSEESISLAILEAQEDETKPSSN